MAAKTFTFRMASEGAQGVIADLRAAAVESAHAQRALDALTRSSPQLASVQDGVQAKMRLTALSMRATQESATGLGAVLGRGGAIGVGLAAATAGFQALETAIGGIPRAGDAALASLARLSAAMGSDTLSKSILQDLSAISRQTGVPLQDTASTFQRFAIAAKDIGTTNAQVVELVAGIQKFGIVAGASTEEVKSATVQLGQALASGKLQGDELRSVLESMPQLAQALAKELNTTVGALKDLGAEGKLTSDVVMPALLRAVQGINTEFEKMPLTMARAQQQFDVSAQSFLAHIDQAIGLSQRLAGILAGAAGTIDRLRQGFGGSTRAERQTQLATEIEDIQARMRAMDQAGEPSLSRQRNRGALVRPMVESRADLEQQLAAARAELLRINNQVVLEAEADAETAQRNGAEGRLSTGQELARRLQDKYDKPAKLRREYAEEMRQLQQLENIGAVDAAQAARLRAAAAKELAEALAKLEDTAKGGASGLSEAEKAAAAAQKAFEAAAKDARSIEASLDPAAAAWQKLEDNLTRIRAAVAGGFLTGARGEQLEQTAFSRLAEELNKLGDSTDKAEDDIGRFFQQMASKTEEAIIRWKGFGNVVTAIGEDIARVLLRRFVTNPLASAGTQLASAGFDFVKGLFSSPSAEAVQLAYPHANGGIMTAQGPVPLRRYAGGGIANSPQMALFGEGSMPEAYVPLPDGRSIPVTMAGGSAIAYSPTINVNVNNSAATATQIAAAVRMAVETDRARFISEINRGGQAARVVGRRSK